MSNDYFLAHIALPISLIYSVASTFVAWLHTRDHAKEHDQRISCRDRLIAACRELKECERNGEIVLKENEELKARIKELTDDVVVGDTAHTGNSVLGPETDSAKTTNNISDFC